MASLNILLVIFLGSILSVTVYGKSKPIKFYLETESGYIIANLVFKLKNITNTEKAAFTRLLLTTEVKQYEESLRRIPKPKRVTRERNHFDFEGKAFKDLNKKDVEEEKKRLMNEKLKSLQNRFHAVRVVSISEEMPKEDENDGFFQ
ncbi:hypothetical protein L9F63_023910 [Diploptera punctata]|uniref:Uncharacterized protein n=1 Tax=Diploptera punctata TaxID=6984 RepID=A0AAD7ZIE5_DIPPU|nr:hypothetical protein L9F63_023910 [Diploptera punctata]